MKNMSVAGQAVNVFTIEKLPVDLEFQVLAESKIRVIGKDGTEWGNRCKCVISRPIKLLNFDNTNVNITDWLAYSEEDNQLKQHDPDQTTPGKQQNGQLSDLVFKTDVKNQTEEEAHKLNSGGAVSSCFNCKDWINVRLNTRSWKPLIINLSVLSTTDEIVDGKNSSNVNDKKELGQPFNDKLPHHESNIPDEIEKWQDNVEEYPAVEEIPAERLNNEKDETKSNKSKPKNTRKRSKSKTKTLKSRKRKTNQSDDIRESKAKVSRKKLNEHHDEANIIEAVKTEPGSIIDNVTCKADKDHISNGNIDIKVEDNLNESQPELKHGSVASKRQRVARKGHSNLKVFKNRTNTRKKTKSEEGSIDINTDGLDPKLVYAKKSLEKQNIKNSRRMRVELEDHTDKYKITVVESLAQKDRGKALEEKSYHSFECTICGRFQSAVAEKIRFHIEQHVNGELECKKCGYILSYPKEISRHNSEVHTEDFVNKRVCELCGVTASSYRMWKAHMSKVHKVPSFRCKHCSEKFFSAAEVVVHTRAEHKDIVLTCDKCGQVFVSRSNWSYHSVRCNGTANADSFVCDQCGKNLSSAIALKRHVRHNHEMEKTQKCTLCSYATHTIARLQKHINAHLGNKQYHCEICQFSCVQKYQLTSHMRTHNGEKPFRCDQCPYAVAWNVQLKAHKKVHNLQSAVNCKMCGVVFRDVKSLSKHEQKDHGIKTSSGKTNTNGGNVVTNATSNIPVVNKVNISVNNCITVNANNIASVGQQFFGNVNGSVSNDRNESLPNINGMLNMNNNIRHLTHIENNQLPLPTQMPVYSFPYQ